MGIRSRILCLALAPCILTAVILTGVLTTSRLQDLNDGLLTRGQLLTQNLAIAALPGLLESDRIALQQLANTVLAVTEVVGVVIEDSDGRVLIDIPSAADIALPSGAAQSENTSYQHLFISPIEMTALSNANDPNRPPNTPTQIATTPQVVGQVRVALETGPTLLQQSAAVKTGVLIALLCLVLAAIVGYGLGRRIWDPILRLDSAVRDLRAGRLDIHTPERSSGELGSLEQGVNAMASTLEASHDHLQEQVDEATAELRETMEELEIKNAELDIARKKAVQASRVKSEFLANMSHEIRTPMNGVMGFIELLSKTALNRTQQGYLQTLRASAENLMVLLNDILDFSKIEAGKFKIRQRSFDLREVLENAVLLFAANAQYKGINLILDIEPDVPSNMVGDAPRIAQIVTNFVSNAVKFTDRGEVEVRACAGTETREEVTLILEIRDTGIGIAPEDQERLFHAFDQLDTSTTRRHSGTGLGLAITHRLVSMMGGQIRVESQPTVGSNFYVSLVLKKQLANHSQVIGISGRPDIVVLLIARDPLLTRAVTHLLEYGGIRTQYAMDLATAAEYLAGTREFTGTLRGIIVDFSVPHLHPDIFLAAAKTSVIGRHCALILMGATEDLEPTRRFSEAFPTVYFANKPPTGRELLTLLDANPQFSSSGEAFSMEGSHDEERVPIFGKAVKARVLLADDNLINRQLARIFLNQLGAQVDEADTGIQAVEACRSNQYDLILMDIHMPDMDGLEATRRIRTLEDSANSVVPVIALTADAMNQERAQYLDAGMNDHLSKPITEESLRSILEKWCLGNNTQLRSSRY